MKALKAFRKPFEKPQRNVKIKIYINFYFNTISEIYGAGRVKHLLAILTTSDLKIISRFPSWYFPPDFPSLLKCKPHDDLQSQMFNYNDFKNFTDKLFLL